MKSPRTALVTLVLVCSAACTAGSPEAADPTDALPSLTPITETPRIVGTATPPAGTSPTAPGGTNAPAQTPNRVKPAWLGTRPLTPGPEGYAAPQPTPPDLRNRQFTLPDTVPALPGTGFESEVVSPAPAEVLRRSTWTSSCPVRANELTWVRLVFHGFDGKRHTGELLVHRTVALQVVDIFEELYAAKFPIEEMRVTRREELTAPPTGDGNNTGAFVCRAAVGSTRYSEHAYGLAIDVNPFQNPYHKGKAVLPELATAYLDRGWSRPGMIQPGSPTHRAFTSRGWGWGGAWQSLKDYQHFSVENR